MWPGRVSNPGSLALELNALPTAVINACTIEVTVQELMTCNFTPFSTVFMSYQDNGSYNGRLYAIEFAYGIKD